MILNTINIFRPRLSSVAIKMIKAHYIPMLALDISDQITMKNMNLKNSEIQQLFKTRLNLLNQIINPADTDLKYAYFIDDVLKKEHSYTMPLKKHFLFRCF